MTTQTSRRVLLLTCGSSMVGLAGCAAVEERLGLDDGQSATDDGSSDPSTQEDESPADEPQEEFNEISNADLPEYSSIQLSTAHLPSGYNLTGEEEKVVHELDGSERESFTDLGIRFMHERAFTADDDVSDVPSTVFSSVVIYDTEDNLVDGRKELQELIEREGGSYTDHSIDGVDTEFIGQYETTDMSNALAYVSIGSIEIYVITSDVEELFQEKAINLIYLLRDRALEMQE